MSHRRRQRAAAHARARSAAAISREVIAAERASQLDPVDHVQTLKDMSALLMSQIDPATGYERETEFPTEYANSVARLSQIRAQQAEAVSVEQA